VEWRTGQSYEVQGNWSGWGVGELGGFGGLFSVGGFGGGGAVLGEGVGPSVNGINQVAVERVAQKKLDKGWSRASGAFEGAVKLVMGFGIVQGVLGFLEEFLKPFGLVFIGGWGEETEAI